jgi:quercetin dioxygenase-like cupin family protein
MTTSNQNLIPTSTENQIYDVFGVRLQFLVTPEETGNQASFLQGTLPSGGLIPLHSHPSFEAFYVLEGTLEVYQESIKSKGWQAVSAGKVIAIAPNVKHALRNTSLTPAISIAVVQKELYDFFHELAKPAGSGPHALPSPEDMQRLFASAAKYSYWLGTPEENAAIGINLG